MNGKVFSALCKHHELLCAQIPLEKQYGSLPLLFCPPLYRSQLVGIAVSPQRVGKQIFLGTVLSVLIFRLPVPLAVPLLEMEFTFH